MISYSYDVDEDSKRIRFSMTGHAGAGQVGQDLVCAAASILWYTLRERMSEERSLISFTEKPGKTYLTAKHSETSAEILKVVLCGYKLLSMQYPDNVQELPW